MSPIAIKSFRTTPTTYFLNGPTLSYGTTQPVSATISNFGNSSFVGITSLVYPSTFPIPPVGLITYRWYDQNGPILDESRSNGGDLGITTFVGAATTTLTILNAINPIDNNKQFYLVSYFQPQNNIGFQTFGSAVNSPLQSSVAILTVRPYLRIVTQPTAVTGTVNDTSVFNISATVSDSSGSISYQWRLNGSNLSNGTSGSLTVTGANTSSLSIRNTTPGNYTVDCVVSHPSTDPGSLTSSSATFTVQANVRHLFIEQMSNGSPGDWEGFGGGTRHNVSDFAGGSVLSLTVSSSQLTYIHAPDEDVDALVTMGGCAANNNGGQGGWMTFRYTFKRGVEHTLITLGRDGGGEARHPLASGGTGTIRGGKGGGGTFLYRLNELLAVCGGGGGGSEGGAGGDGAGANIPNGTRSGQKGFGVNGGLGGDAGPDNSSPGYVSAATLDNYWFNGVIDSSVVSKITANNYGWVNTPDSLPTGVFGPAYAFGGQFIYVDYRSSRTEASRGSRVFRNPRGTINWINQGFREGTGDCYRFVGYASTYSSGSSDADTRNDESSDYSIADYKAGRVRQPGFFDAAGRYLGTPIDYNAPVGVMQGCLDNVNKKNCPNSYWNKIGNGEGQTPGYPQNFYNRIARVENVGGSDDFNSTHNGTTRRTKAICSRFQRDDPDQRMFVARNSAEIIRGFRFGYGARANGGWSKFGGAGGGSGAGGGASGAGYPYWSGGGGGSGWADGRCEVLQSVDGGSIGEGFISIKAVNPNVPISSQLPALPTSPNPSWQVLDWNDYRNYGWRRDSDGEQWPTDASGGTSFSVGSCSNLNGTFIQSPITYTRNTDVGTSNSYYHGTRDTYDSGNIHKKGGLDEQYNNYHRLFVGGCREGDTPGGSIADGTGGNLYFPSESSVGQPSGPGNADTLLQSLRLTNRTQSLEQVAYLEFELKLPGFSASQFESYLGSRMYVSDRRPYNSWEFIDEKKYVYNQSNPPSKYLLNDNGQRPRWSPFTDKVSSGGQILYPSSNRWTNNFDQAYIPFEATFELILEFDEILYHSDRRAAPSDIQQYKRMVITKTYDFRNPWQRRNIDFRSEDLWNAIGVSGSGSKFRPPSADIYNYRNPRFTSFRISSVRDLDTGGINTLNLYPVLEPKKLRDRDYVKLEVGRGIFR